MEKYLTIGCDFMEVINDLDKSSDYNIPGVENCL
jgi:hypothetical protein